MLPVRIEAILMARSRDEGEVMRDFARGREIFAIIAMRIASIRIGSTQY